ncbi:MAG: hypothetical protein WEB52_14220 [Dehalococcoidia bacterium]
MAYDYFVASRYRNKQAVLDLVSRIRARGKSAYCFFESDEAQFGVVTPDEDPEAIMQKFESLIGWRDDPKVIAIFEADMKALRDSAAIILLLPAGKSAHIEAGVGYGLGKKLILIGEQHETESLYLIFSEAYASVEEFVASMSDN